MVLEVRQMGVAGAWRKVGGWVEREVANLVDRTQSSGWAGRLRRRPGAGGIEFHLSLFRNPMLRCIGDRAGKGIEIADN